MKLRDLASSFFRSIVATVVVGIVDWFVITSVENDLSIALLPVFVATLLALASARFFPDSKIWRAALITLSSAMLSIVLQFLAIKISLPGSTDVFITQLPSIVLRLAVVLLTVNMVWEFTIQNRAPQD